LLLILAVFASNAATRQVAIFGQHNPVSQLLALVGPTADAPACGGCCGMTGQTPAPSPLELPGCA